MNQYIYEIRLDSGQIEEKTAEAKSASELVARIEGEGFQLVSIRQVARNPALVQLPGRSAAEAVKELAASGKRWLPALKAMVDEMPAGSARRETASMVGLLDRGTPTSKLIESTDGAMLLPILNSGRVEHSSGGDSHWIFRRIEEIERQRAARQARWQAMVYPAILSLLAAALMCIIGIFIVPTFRELYEDFGIALPAPTRLLIRISDQLTSVSPSTAMSLVVVLGGGFLLVFGWRKLALTNQLLGRLVAGTSTNLRSMSRLTSALAELLSLNTSLDEALKVAGCVSGNRYFEQACVDLAERLQHGEEWKQSRGARRLPPLMHTAIALPLERRDASVALLRELSAAYADRSRRRVDWFASGIYTVAVLVIGCVALFAVIALLMPLIHLVSSLA